MEEHFRQQGDLSVAVASENEPAAAKKQKKSVEEDVISASQPANVLSSLRPGCAAVKPE